MFEALMDGSVCASREPYRNAPCCCDVGISGLGSISFDWKAILW